MSSAVHQPQLVPGRECGGCTVCCKELTIDSAELKKPPGLLCAHCTGQGCGIYQSRPLVCDGFYCGWRQMPLLDDGWRPDRSEILITTATKHIPAGYPPQGLTFELTGSLERVGWPPFLNLVCDLIEDRIPVFLSVRGEPGHVSAKIFLNDRLVAAIMARDPQWVVNGMLDAVEICIAHPKDKVSFRQT